jgi:hypothetical protein
MVQRCSVHATNEVQGLCSLLYRLRVVVVNRASMLRVVAALVLLGLAVLAVLLYAGFIRG